MKYALFFFLTLFNSGMYALKEDEFELEVNKQNITLTCHEFKDRHYLTNYRITTLLIVGLSYLELMYTDESTVFMRLIRGTSLGALFFDVLLNCLTEK